MSSLAPPPFLNRSDAGLQLAARVAHLEVERPVVVAIAPDGVPLAMRIAAKLGAPLGVVLVEAIEPVRGHHVGAAADSGPAVVDPTRAFALGIGAALLEQLALTASEHARARAHPYPPGPALTGRMVVLVDDGGGHGFKEVAAARAVRRRGATRVLLATPVISRAILAMLRGEIDDSIHVAEAAVSHRPSTWYEDARALTDDDARALLAKGTLHAESASKWPSRIPDEDESGTCRTCGAARDLPIRASG